VQARSSNLIMKYALSGAKSGATFGLGMGSVSGLATNIFLGSIPKDHTMSFFNISTGSLTKDVACGAAVGAVAFSLVGASLGSAVGLFSKAGSKCKTFKSSSPKRPKTF